MRILMMIHSLRRGGAERVCLELAVGLKERGDTVEVVSWVNVDEYHEPCYQDIKRHFLIPNLEYRWIRSIPRSAQRFRFFVNTFRPDVVVFHTPNVVWLAAWARLKVPCVQVLHGYGEITYIGSSKASLYKFLTRLAQKQLKTIVVAVSASMKSVAAPFFGIPEDDIFIIENGVDLLKFNSVPCQPPFPPQIIIIGTLCENKGQTMGLKVFHQLVEKQQDSTLIIVGEGAEVMDELKQLIIRYALSNKVKLLGQRADIGELLAKSHVLWQLSLSEAMPMVVLEAMCVGIPVVGFNVRGTKDAVLNGVTGYLVPYGDLNGIMETTLALLANHEDWETFSQNAKHRAMTNFSLSMMVDKYQYIFAKVQRANNNPESIWSKNINL